MTCEDTCTLLSYFLDFWPHHTRRVLKNPVFRLHKKISEARRAKNRRAEAYLTSTLERGD